MNKLKYSQDTICCQNCAPKVRDRISGTVLNYIAASIPCIAFFAAGFLFNNNQWLRLLFFLAAYLIIGWDVILEAFKNVIKGMVIDENFLMTIATFGAFLIGEYPEAVAVMLFYKTGMLLEGMAVDKSKKSIEALIDIRPSYANLKTKDGIEKVVSQNVHVGDTIVVMPGERVPLDGIVSSGSSYLDTSPITGESMPKPVTAGDTVLSGSINGSGAICIEVTKDFSQSTASKILDIVQNAASRKARIENFMSKFAKYYTPVVIAASFLTALLPPVITGKFNFSFWLYRALVFLVISCPCALVISIPLSFFSGLGSASRRGILIKGSNYLDALNSVGTVVFDKTGTLTTGMFQVIEVVAAKGYDSKKVLEYAAMAEARSNHPLAQSILKAYGEHVSDDGIEEYEEISGYGIRMVSRGREILAGNDKLLHRGDPIEHDTCNISGTVIHIALDKEYVGYILFSDEVKEDSFRTVNGLRELGVSSIVMFTGDSIHAAQTVGQKLKLDGIYSSLLPHEKVEQFEILKEKNTDRKGKFAGKNHIMFVGDGINDAPILAMADIGVAMGALGSDAAIEASDIVLMAGQPSALVDAFKIARKTRRIVLQNIIIALGVKLSIMLLGAAGMATMWEAVFADVGVTLIAVFNSLRLLKLNGLSPNKP